MKKNVDIVCERCHVNFTITTGIVDSLINGVLKHKNSQLKFK